MMPGIDKLNGDRGTDKDLKHQLSFGTKIGLMEGIKAADPPRGKHKFPHTLFSIQSK